MSRTCPLCKGTGVEPVSGTAAEAYARGRDEGYEAGYADGERHTLRPAPDAITRSIQRAARRFSLDGGANDAGSL